MNLGLVPAWEHKCSNGMRLLEESISGCIVCGAENPRTKLRTKNMPSPDSTLEHYRSLRSVLDRAYDQAASGKGAERHGQDLPFEEQPMQTVSRLINTHGGLLYQAIKKAQESTRMDKDAAVRELLGSINYLAGAIIYLESEHG